MWYHMPDQQNTRILIEQYLPNGDTTWWWNTTWWWKILVGDEKEWNLAISNNVDGTGRYYVKQNKLEKDRYHMISLMWNLRNSTDEHREGKEK